MHQLLTTLYRDSTLPALARPTFLPGPRVHTLYYSLLSILFTN